MPPFWKRPEPKKPEPMKHELGKPEQSQAELNQKHAAEPIKPLPGQVHKRTRKEIQLEAFELDRQAHSLANEYMSLVDTHGSEAKVPPVTLQDLHRRADILRARQDAVRKEYETST